MTCAARCRGWRLSCSRGCASGSSSSKRRGCRGRRGRRGEAREAQRPTGSTRRGRQGSPSSCPRTEWTRRCGFRVQSSWSCTAVAVSAQYRQALRRADSPTGKHGRSSTLMCISASACVRHSAFCFMGVGPAGGRVLVKQRDVRHLAAWRAAVHRHGPGGHLRGRHDRQPAPAGAAGLPTPSGQRSCRWVR